MELEFIKTEALHCHSTLFRFTINETPDSHCFIAKVDYSFLWFHRGREVIVRWICDSDYSFFHRLVENYDKNEQNIPIFTKNT